MIDKGIQLIIIRTQKRNRKGTEKKIYKETNITISMIFITFITIYLFNQQKVRHKSTQKLI